MRAWPTSDRSNRRTLPPFPNNNTPSLPPLWVPGRKKLDWPLAVFTGSRHFLLSPSLNLLFPFSLSVSRSFPLVLSSTVVCETSSSSSMMLAAKVFVVAVTLGVAAALAAPAAPSSGDTAPAKASCDEIRRSLELTLLTSVKEVKYKRVFLNMLPGLLATYLPTLCDPELSSTTPRGSIPNKQRAPSRRKRAFLFGLNGGFNGGYNGGSNGEGNGEGSNGYSNGYSNGFLFGNGKIKDPGDHPVNGNGLGGLLQLALVGLVNGALNGGYDGGKNGGNGGNGGSAKLEITI